MPIYQYDCGSCGRRVDIYVRSAAAGQPRCPQCGGRRLSRVMSAFAQTRPEGDRLERIDLNREIGRLGGNSEAEFAHWARRVGRDHDEELGTNFRELAERAEAGEDPVERIDAGHKLRYEVQKSRAAARKGGRKRLRTPRHEH